MFKTIITDLNTKKSDSSNSVSVETIDKVMEGSKNTSKDNHEHKSSKKKLLKFIPTSNR
jgi:hypothetical protein